MPNKAETKEHCYFVQSTEHGIYVTDPVGRCFFRTNVGGWFWTGGPDFLFGEHVRITGPTAEYLSSIVETAQLDLDNNQSSSDGREIVKWAPCQNFKPSRPK